MEKPSFVVGEAGGDGEPPKTDPRAKANFFLPLLVGLMGGEVGLIELVGLPGLAGLSAANGLLVGILGLGLITLLLPVSNRVGETGNECVDEEGNCQCPMSALPDEDESFDVVQVCCPPPECESQSGRVGDAGEVGEEDEVVGENGEERDWERRKPGGGGKAEMRDWRQCNRSCGRLAYCLPFGSAVVAEESEPSLSAAWLSLGLTHGSLLPWHRRSSVCVTQ